MSTGGSLTALEAAEGIYISRIIVKSMIRKRQIDMYKKYRGREKSVLRTPRHGLPDSNPCLPTLSTTAVSITFSTSECH